MTDESSLIEFPCDFTLKIVGVNSTDFIPQVSAVILQHFPQTAESNISNKMSQQSNYVAISAIVHALDKPSLDSLYSELTKLPGIKMVL